MVQVPPAILMQALVAGLLLLWAGTGQRAVGKEKFSYTFLGSVSESKK